MYIRHFHRTYHCWYRELDATKWTSFQSYYNTQRSLLVQKRNLEITQWKNEEDIVNGKKIIYIIH